jgi:hypothetical protein
VNTPSPERRNMLYAGTLLAAGNGRAVIVAHDQRRSLVQSVGS